MEKQTAGRQGLAESMQLQLCTILIKNHNHGKRINFPKTFQYDNSCIDTISKIRCSKLQVKRPRRSELNQPPWWNDDIERAWKNKRQAVKA